MEVRSYINVIKYILEKSGRVIGGEENPFHHSLRQIIYQMRALQIPDEHKLPRLFEVLAGRAKEAVQKIRSKSSNIDERVERLACILVLEYYIQQGKMNCCNAIKISDFHAKVIYEHETTGIWLQLLGAHLKDLPVHMNNNVTILEHISSVFKDLTLYMTIDEHKTANQDPFTLGQLLKMAASNFDEFPKGSNCGSNFSFLIDSDSSSVPEMVVPFFERTRSPPHLWQPHRYQRRRFSNCHGNAIKVAIETEAKEKLLDSAALFPSNRKKPDEASVER